MAFGGLGVGLEAFFFPFRRVRVDFLGDTSAAPIEDSFATPASNIWLDDILRNEENSLRRRGCADCVTMPMCYLVRLNRMMVMQYRMDDFKCQ